MVKQYIDKSALVAEINRVLNSYDTNEITSGRYALAKLRDFIDTLEVIEIGVDVGSPEGDIGVKTIWDGDMIVSDKAQKGE